MKISIKSGFLPLAAALSLSACSENDIREIIEQDNRIIFCPSVPAVTSRSSVTTTENLKHFYVTAFDPADDAKLIGGKLDPNFQYEKIDVVKGGNEFSSPFCVWPDAGMEDHVVTFFGFHPGLIFDQGETLTNTSTASRIDYKYSGFRVQKDITKHVDFISAYASGSMARNLVSGIELPFKHQLCRIHVKAWSNHKSCDIEIAGVRIGGVYTKATFNFKTDAENPGFWSDYDEKNLVEYIFGYQDKVVSLKKGEKSTSIDTGALSIMGNAQPDGNDAMLIPTTYSSEWKPSADGRNTANGLYLSVLLRVIYRTENGKAQQQYPYKDLKQGADAMKIDRVYLAVNKADNTVACRLRLDDGIFYDENNEPYKYPADEEIKEFGWAAIPITGNWLPGHVYTYTLNYSHGVGLHDPEVTTTAPKAGDPIISDRVRFTYDVKDWNDGGGDEFIVPGS